MSDATEKTLPTSEEYRSARRRLREAELALRDQIEAVAELRRALPAGPVVDDRYAFAEGDPDLAVKGPGTDRETRLPELFTPNPELLFVYHMMFDPEWEQGCRMCSLWLDGLNAVAHHVRETTSFAVVAKAELPKLRAWARHRGWDRLRLLSSYGTDFNHDLGAEHPEWGQQARVSVLTKDAGGTVRLAYWGDPYFREGKVRGIDLLSPVWNVLDLLPGGRGDWEPSDGH